MTPVVGLVAALIAALLASNRRAVLIGVLPPLLGANAAQVWYLVTGRGHNPASTTTKSPGYWIVQTIIGALVCAVAIAIYVVRTRRAAAVPAAAS